MENSDEQMPNPFDKLMNTFFDKAKSYTYEEFAAAVKSNQIKFEIRGNHHYKLLYGTRKFVFYFFLFLYMFAPFIIIPIFAYYEENWWLLTGIAVSFIGMLSAARNSSILIGISLPIAIVSWIKYGFSIYQYVTYFFFCLWWGYMFFAMASGCEDEYAKQIVLENEKLFYRLVEHDAILVFDANTPKIK